MRRQAPGQGKILAIKWGMNPNSSSLGVDVTFLLVGATALAMVTPIVGALLRWRKALPVEPTIAAPAETSE
jgi:hypothetical protein